MRGPKSILSRRRVAEAAKAVNPEDGRIAAMKCRGRYTNELGHVRSSELLVVFPCPLAEVAVGVEGDGDDVQLVDDKVLGVYFEILIIFWFIQTS